MKKPKVDSNGVCIDFKNPYCGMCNRLNSDKCCRTVPSYKQKIDAWNQRMKKISGEVTGITLAIGALEDTRQQILGKLHGSDLDRIEKLVEIAKRKPGFGIRFMYDGAERSCFDCVHCEKSFVEEPCHKCLGGAERGIKQINAPGSQFETYEYASHFEPKQSDRDIAVQKLAKQYHKVFKSIKKDAIANGVSMYEILAHLIGVSKL